MSGQEAICREARRAWFASPAESQEAELEAHRRACAACTAWVRGVERQREALAELPRRRAPRALEERLTEAFPGLSAAEGTGRLELGLQALRTLTCHPAPAVLERLVAEELSDPARHRVERFTDLERLQAPDVLARRLERRLRRRDLAYRFGPLVGVLSAALLLAWLTLGGVFSPAGPSRRPFEVVHAHDPSLLDPWARDSLAVLGGAGASTGPANVPPTIGSDPLEPALRRGER